MHAQADACAYYESSSAMHMRCLHEAETSAWVVIRVGFRLNSIDFVSIPMWLKHLFCLLQHIQLHPNTKNQQAT